MSINTTTFWEQVIADHCLSFYSVLFDFYVDAICISNELKLLSNVI